MMNLFKQLILILGVGAVGANKYFTSNENRD
nr:MAG TPA: hypothetical protein [Caudoviricetes sp.]